MGLATYLILRKSFITEWKHLKGWVKVKVAQVMSDSLWPHGILQARILEWVAFPFPRGSSQPRNWTQVSCIAGGFLSAEPQGKPKNTGVGSLSLLWRTFPTQELNPGLLHCRRIPYQLSYQGSPEEGGYGEKKLGKVFLKYSEVYLGYD